MKHFDKDVTDEMRKYRDEYISSRSEQLYDLAVDSGDQALKYLFLTNSGGAVAVLAYLGSSATPVLSMKISVILFFIGILFVGFYRTYNVHSHESLFANFKNLVEKYYQENIGWVQLLDTDSENIGRPVMPYIFSYASFSCFILGCIIGACSVL